MSANPTSSVDIKLAPRLDLNAAEALHSEILSEREGVSTLVIDASEVSLIDTPAVQVLLAAEKDQAARGGELALRAPSPAFEEAMHLLGLESQLETWRGKNE